MRGEYGDLVFALDIQARGLGLVTSFKEEDLEEALKVALSVIPAVLRGYRFEAFDRVEIQMTGMTQPLILDRDLLELYDQKKISLNELLTPHRLNLPAQDPKFLLNQ